MNTQPIEGNGTLTFEDGESFDVHASVQFRRIGDTISGHGKIRSDRVVALGFKNGPAILNVGGKKTRVLIGPVNLDYAEVSTTG